MNTIKICSICAATMNGKPCKKCGSKIGHVITEQKSLCNNESTYNLLDNFHRTQEELPVSEIPFIPTFGYKKTMTGYARKKYVK